LELTDITKKNSFIKEGRKEVVVVQFDSIQMNKNNRIKVKTSEFK
jgi:hypothetical protein